MSFLRERTNKLLLRIKKGDEKSKNLLFECTSNHLIVVARKFLDNKNNLEDVVSSAYLRAFDYISSFNPSQDGYNWLCKIVQNLCYDYNKKEQKWVPIDSAFGIAAADDIETQFVQKNMIEEYLSVYSELDKRFIYLRFWEDRSFSEIAHLTGSKKSYVHKRVSKILKEILKKAEKEKK